MNQYTKAALDLARTSVVEVTNKNINGAARVGAGSFTPPADLVALDTCDANSISVDEARLLIPAIDQNGELFPVEKFKAHQDATQHLAISIFLFMNGRMVLQRRASAKYHSGGLWANACCSHPHWGESIDDCAGRRLQEELGCSVPLQSHGIVDYYADVGEGMIENERAHIYTGQIDDIGEQLKINLDEVLAVEVFEADTLKSKLEKHPERFTAWFKEYMSRDDEAIRSALSAGGFDWF